MRQATRSCWGGVSGCGEGAKLRSREVWSDPRDGGVSRPPLGGGGPMQPQTSQTSQEDPPGWKAGKGHRRQRGRHSSVGGPVER